MHTHRQLIDELNRPKNKDDHSNSRLIERRRLAETEIQKLPGLSKNALPLYEKVNWTSRARQYRERQHWPIQNEKLPSEHHGRVDASRSAFSA